ncbi:MAG: DUF5677 domain-containing protein [Thermodesulfovibrionales bacterium]|jgi:hypothetical protein
MNDTLPIIYTPENEPYLGRKLLYHFDQIICSAMEQNSKTAPTTHGAKLSDLQIMACQVVAQSLSIVLSIRELIRQGYLFGAHVLVRSLVERATILLYIHYSPNEIEKWNKGWQHNNAPSLAKMFEVIQRHQGRDEFVKGFELTKVYNSLVHGKPDSAPWNHVVLSDGSIGHASSKIINRPDLCDEVCAQVIPWVAVIQGMMAAYFSDKESAQQLH